jgi:hypothetical protein
MQDSRRRCNAIQQEARQLRQKEVKSCQTAGGGAMQDNRRRGDARHQIVGKYKA